MKTTSSPLITYHRLGLEKMAMLYTTANGFLPEGVMCDASWNWDAQGLESSNDISITITVETEVEE